MAEATRHSARRLVPKDSGIGLIDELMSKFPGVRILIVCDRKDETVALEGMKAGAHGTPLKPLTLEAVRKKVDTILGRGGAASCRPAGS